MITYDCFSLQMNWTEANLYATYLVEGSKWSRTIYSYQKATIMCMRGSDLSVADLGVITTLMK